ncbi:MAG: hypothetical protein QOI38_670 [Sphingomonadales bacterium]|nr:hypothetical protein [Sphingomonadales bacterium]
MPYWERRVEGWRFLEWLTCLLSLAVFGLILLLSRPLEMLDYVGLAVSGATAADSAYRLIRGAGRWARED